MQPANHVVNELGQPIGSPLPNWSPPPWPVLRTVDGRFCRLEPLHPLRHGPELHAANSMDSEGRLWTYLPYGPFPEVESYIQWLRENTQGNDPLFYAIVDSLRGKAMGSASYLRIAPASGSIEVGHVNYSPLLQRQPAATEAMFLMMRQAFALGYRRYEWKCDTLNLRSRAAAQRLGFSFEGVFRQATVYKGRTRDTAWYSVIDREWPALERAFEQWLAPSNFTSSGQQRTSLSQLTGPLLAQRG